MTTITGNDQGNGENTNVDMVALVPQEMRYLCTTVADDILNYINVSMYSMCSTLDNKFRQLLNQLNNTINSTLIRVFFMNVENILYKEYGETIIVRMVSPETYRPIRCALVFSPNYDTNATSQTNTHTHSHMASPPIGEKQRRRRTLEVVDGRRTPIVIDMAQTPSKRETRSKHF